MSRRQRRSEMAARGIRVVLLILLLLGGVGVGLLLGIRPGARPESAEPESGAPPAEAPVNAEASSAGETGASVPAR
jgi:hypothetical protein